MSIFSNMRLHRRTLVAAFSLGLTAFGVAISSSNGASDTLRNGRIAFVDGNGILSLTDPHGRGSERVANLHIGDGASGLSFSPDGKRIAYDDLRGDYVQLFTIGTNGRDRRRVTFVKSATLDPARSPDGTRLAFETFQDTTSQTDIYSISPNGKSLHQLTRSLLHERDPSWSPDSEHIAYTVQTGDRSDFETGRNTREIWVMNSDGSHKHQLTDAPSFSENPDWSPDGLRIVFESDRSDPGNLDIYSMRVDGTDVQRLTSDPELDALPAYSPDGTKVVFVSERDHKGSRKLYVMNADGTGVTLLSGQQGWRWQQVPDWQPRPFR